MTMESAITSGVKVTVNTRYMQEQSEPGKGAFLFSYDVFITNNNLYPVQLLSRHWIIYDSLFPKREIRGEGVVGEKPIIEPGETFRYQSFCDLHSSIGWMQGEYLFRVDGNQQLLEVTIPKFELMLPEQMN